MGLLDLFKLEKLKVEAYKTAARGTGDLVDTFEAMFNPASFAQAYKTVYSKSKSFSYRGEKVDFQRTAPSELKLNLVIDGMGVTDFGIVSLLSKKKTVADQVNQFLTLTFAVNGDIHEPNYLRLTWGGGLNLACRLGAVSVNYTSFDRDGTPLRAELDATFLSDPDPDKQAKLTNLHSPDLTRRVVVKAGDTLPLLSRQVYGSPLHYLMVASVNGLDDFRDLPPGLELSFPPLPGAGRPSA